MPEDTEANVAKVIKVLEEWGVNHFIGPGKTEDCAAEIVTVLSND